LHTEEPLDAITFSANGELLASASNGIVQLWRLDRREMLTKLSLNPLLLFTFTPDHKLVGLSGPNAIKDPGELNVWRGESVSDFTPALPQLGNAMLHCAAVSPDGAMLVTGAEDGSVRLWNLASRLQLGLVLTGHYEEVDSVKFSIDGQWMVSEGKDGVIFWNTVSREPWGPPFLTKNQYREAVFSKDGKYLAVVEGKNIVRLWDMVLQRFLDTTLGTFEETVNHLVFSPDGKVLAIQSGENLSFWDIPQLQPINAFLKGFNFPRFSPDSTLFAATGVEGDRVWDVPHFRGIELPLQGNVKIVLAPGGRLYIKPRAENGSSNQADEIPWRLWDMANRQFIERPIKLMADSDQMSPDGRLLLMPGEDEGIRLYDVARQEVLNPPLKGHKNFGDFVFSPDSKILASTPGPLSDADIRLWDIETLQPLGQPFGGSVMYPRNPVFSPDGKILAAAYRFGVILWDMDVESWKRRACRMANRNLTMEEWKQYLGDRSYHNTCPDLPGAKEGKGAQ
jgi:WD40 repeat protein